MNDRYRRKHDVVVPIRQRCLWYNGVDVTYKRETGKCLCQTTGDDLLLCYRRNPTPTVLSRRNEVTPLPPRSSRGFPTIGTEPTRYPYTLDEAPLSERLFGSQDVFRKVKNYGSTSRSHGHGIVSDPPRPVESSRSKRERERNL